MKEGPKPEKPRPPRWDSYPLPGKYETPRWDAGVRYWPGAVMIGSFIPLFVGLNIAFGFSNGPLLTAAVIASYPILLILAPLRKRLVPREVGAATSPLPLRLWVLGFFLFAAATASYSIFFNFGISSGSLVNFITFWALTYGLLMGGLWCIRKAPAWEQWRHRPRKKGRKSRQNGNGAPTEASTFGQPH